MPQKSSGEENILYVVLHGLVTLIDVKEKGFLAHVLEIGDEHEYLLGDWLEEAAIPERRAGQEPLRATLTHVDSGPAQLDPERNAVLKLNSVPADTSGHVRAVLRLPRPGKIYNFVRGKLPANALAGDLGGLVRTPSEISGTVVFEYTFQDKERVALVNDSGTEIWKPKGLAFVSVPGRELAVAVLHVYDEPGIRLPGDMLKDLTEHNRREFKLSGEFLASNVELVKDAGTPLLLQKDETPPGLLPGEVTNLDERDQSVFAIVLGLRQGSASGAAAGGGSAGPVCGGMHAQLI